MALQITLAALIAVATAVILVAGATITVYANRAARRTNSRPMRLFSYGFATITFGLLCGGLGALVGLDSRATLLVQAALIAPGFLLLFRSVHAMSPRVTRARES